MSGPHLDPRDQPGYRAEFDPGDHRDVGHGKELGADLHALYLAGRTHLPALAQQFVTMSDASHQHRARVQYLADSVQNPPAMSAAAAMADELAVALYRTSLALADSGQALVSIATDYASTDEVACKEFNRLNRIRSDELGLPTPPVTPPISPSEPTPTYVPPEPPSLLDRLKDLGDRVGGGLSSWWEDLTDGEPPEEDGASNGGDEQPWGDDLTPTSGGQP